MVQARHYFVRDEPVAAKKCSTNFVDSARSIFLRALRAFLYLVEAEVENRVLPPGLVVVVPPLGLVDCEAFGLHRGAQGVAEAALFGSPARVRDVRALRH